MQANIRHMETQTNIHTRRRANGKEANWERGGEGKEMAKGKEGEYNGKGEVGERKTRGKWQIM